jgi:hypothetical protein
MSYVVKELDWQDTAHENYIIRHWRGHLSLPISYWINGLIIPTALSLALLLTLDYLARTDIGLPSLALLDLAYLVFSAALWIWSIVGIWRSAGYHEERGGSPGWANVARALVILAALGAFGQSHNRFLYLLEQGQLAFGEDPLGDPAKMVIDPRRKTVLLDGNITAGTAERFEKFMASHPQTTALALRSNGGRTREAERMARLISKRGLNTEARDYCMSACTLLLLAGRERTATSDARVGFHQPQFPGLTGEAQQALTSDLRELYVKAGVDPGFLDKALSVSPQSMWFPTVDELIDAKVITASPIVIRNRSKLEVQMRSHALQEYLDYTAKQINGTSPLLVDKVTTRTGAKATPGVLTIRFRIAGDRSQFDAGLAKRKLGPVLTGQVCRDNKTSLAVDDGAKFVFAYYDRSGALAFTIPVSTCDAATSR